MRFLRGKDVTAPGGPAKRPAAPGMARFWLGGFVGVALVLLVTAVVGTYGWVSGERIAAEQTLLAWAEATARDAAHRLAAVRGLLQTWADDPALQRVCRASDAAGMRAQEQLMARQIPETLGVRLVAPNTAGILDTGGPPMSHAAIDLVERAFEERKLSAFEVHRVAQPDMHLAIAGPVLDTQGGKVLCIVHLAMPLSLLPTVTDLGGHAGRVRYQQSAGKEVATLAVGQTEAPTDAAPQGFVEIPGTSLRLGVWPARAGRFGGAPVIAVAAGYMAALGLVGLTLWLPYRRLKRALAEDHAGLVTLVQDAVMRRLVQVSACRVAESEQVQAGLLPLLSAIGSSQTPAAGPREPVAPPSEQEAAEPARAVPGGTGGVVDPGRPPTDVHSEIFRAYDIRGIVGQGIDEELMRGIGQAVGSEVAAHGGGPVMVARDTRPSSEPLTAALIAGLRASGREVIDLGVAPTPLLYFATHQQRDISGVMVTASHNPPEYNGCKVVLNAQCLEGDQLRVIERRIRNRDLVELPEGGYQKRDLAPAYVDHIERDVALARGLKLVVDGGNGAASVLAPALYRTLGCEVVELHCDPAGGFPDGQVPDPSRAENVRDLSAAVTAQGADLGLAFDGDGDRLGVVDSQGQFIAMDRVLMLFAADVLSRYPGTDVVYDVKCTHHLAAEIVRSGGRPLMWQCGHSRLKSKLRETGALLAGELSGHVIFQERWFGFDDAVYAGARLLELLALDPRSSADVFAALPDALGTPELVLPLQDGEPEQIMERVLALAGRLDGVTVKTVDGLRAEFDGGWGLVRASNTRPALSFRFQGDDQQSLDLIQALFRRVMSKVAPGLVLPF